jgi:hypothetical protein
MRHVSVCDSVLRMRDVQTKHNTKNIFAKYIKKKRNKIVTAKPYTIHLKSQTTCRHLTKNYRC